MTKNNTFTPWYFSSAEVRKGIHIRPEYQLLWAVLEEAVETYMKYATATHCRGERLFHEAADWIFQDDYTRFCSFTNICHILEIDPDYVRTGLVRWRTAQRTGAKRVAA
jgi:hypothetical protein